MPRGMGYGERPMMSHEQMLPGKMSKPMMKRMPMVDGVSGAGFSKVRMGKLVE